MRKAIIPIFLMIIFSCSQKEETKVTEPKQANLISKAASILSDPEPVDSIISIELAKEEPPKEPELDVIDELSPSYSNLLENLSFTIDSILVDSNETLLYLPWGLANADLSSDNKFLYALNTKSNKIYQFDLDRLELVNSYQFEREGPNSVPPKIWKFQLLNGQKIGFADYQFTGIYNFQTQKLFSYQFSEKDFSKLLDAPTIPKYESLQLSLDGKRIFFLHKNVTQEKVYLGIFDPEKEEGKLVELEEFGFLTRLYFSHTEGITHYVSNFADLGMKIEENRALIYSKGTSKVYLYDLSSGSLTFKSPQHKLVPNEQIPPFSNQISTNQEVIDASNSLLFQISYLNFIYDDQRKMYFRFASIMEKTEDHSPKTKKDVYLFAYDQNLNLKGETKIDELVKVPSYPFFKDGKLWSYVNVEDELGFAVFTFDF